MSEIEERLEEATEEEKKEVLPTADEESIVPEVTEIEEPRPEETLLYDVTKPEMLEIMLVAVDILEKASSGALSADEARKLYTKNVLEAMKKLIGEGVVLKKTTRRVKAKVKTAKSKKKEKTAKKTRKKSKSAKKKTKTSASTESESKG